MKKLLSCFIWVVVFNLAYLPASHAQTEQIKRFKDWEVICEHQNDVQSGIPTDQENNKKPEPQLTKNRCQISQKLGISDTPTIAFAITILKTDTGPYAVIISFPLGGYLTPGILMSVDQTKPYKVLVETCIIAVCHAGFPFTGPLEKQWRKGKQVQFEIWANKIKSTTFSISLNGLNEALTYIDHL